ncbi:ABC transporter ATP-binding protein [Boudabousia liubingyangii]|nr:ABC transporter ATP-binding protein [Boudabousia liubingyangii]
MTASETSPQPKPSLSAQNLRFAYGDKEILAGLDLEIKAGQVLGLLGPNGAGKSTLLGVLCRDLNATSGQVLLNQKPLASYPQKELARQRAVMPQKSEFPFAYLARDIVAMGRNCWENTEKAALNETLIDRAMAETEVTHLAERDITHLSGGEQARVTLARVLAQDTPIVFLDEPTAALDISHQQRTMQSCRNLAAQGAAVVAVMHDLQLAAAYCDQLCLLSEGKIIALGTPKEVLQSDRLSEVYEWPIRVLELPDGELVILPETHLR